MIYRARTESNEMFIAMYETEEPKPHQFTKPENSWSQDADAFYEAYKKWQSSKREYKVRSEYKDEVERLVINECIMNTNPLILRSEARERLSKGLDCTFLKNRLKLEWGSIIRGSNRLPDDLNEWTLLPLEDKKENEADKWISVKDKMPPKDNRHLPVLLFNGDAPLYNQHVFQGSWSGKDGYFGNLYTKNYLGTITHWMPLPEPPTIQEPE